MDILFVHLTNMWIQENLLSVMIVMLAHIQLVHSQINATLAATSTRQLGPKTRRPVFDSFVTYTIQNHQNLTV